MKKISLIIFSVLCSFFVAIPAGATVTGTSSGYNAVTYDNSIEFTATLNSAGKVEASWSKYNHSDNFTYYKLVRSISNSNPVYPEDSYIYYTSNVDALSYVDGNVPNGISYYRICQIASPNRYCSEKVVTIDTTATTTTTTTTTVNHIKLSGASSGSTINLEWSLADTSANGFKVVWGKNPNPVYPKDQYTEGYHYLTNGEKTDKITGLANGKYYVRVCIYEGGVCEEYSNQLILDVNKNSTSTEENNACDDISSPVCGSDGKTYSNSCYAKKVGITSYTSGKCAQKTETTTVKPTTGIGNVSLETITNNKPLNEMSRDELLKVLITLLIALLSK